MSKSYAELLRDPRWQRKRLEIMERADFACEECGRGDTTLNVHHAYYEKNRSPWDYHSDSLRCLCESCHGSVEADVLILRSLFGRMVKAARFNIIGYVCGMAAVEGGETTIPLPQSHRDCVCAGIGNFFGVPRGVVAGMVVDDRLDLMAVWNLAMRMPTPSTPEGAI